MAVPTFFFSVLLIPFAQLPWCTHQCPCGTSQVGSNDFHSLSIHSDCIAHSQRSLGSVAVRSPCRTDIGIDGTQVAVVSLGAISAPCAYTAIGRSTAQGSECPRASFVQIPFPFYVLFQSLFSLVSISMECGWVFMCTYPDKIYPFKIAHSVP